MMLCVSYCSSLGFLERADGSVPGGWVVRGPAVRSVAVGTVQPGGGVLGVGLKPGAGVL